MSDLGRAVERILTGGTSAPSFQEQLGALVAHEGSGRAAARALGVSEATVRRWRKGTVPKAGNMAAFDRVARDLRARQITNADLRIRTSESDGRGGRRERELTAKHLRLGDQAAADVRRAYVDGGADAAARALYKAIPESQRFYRTYLGDPDEDQSDANAGHLVDDYGAAILA